jgi:glycosyltransferase involved in cell wall biosynthesis
MPPLVSVIVTAYNHEQYIADTIQSVLGQTFRDYEVIVVDDGSTDGTAEQVAAFTDRVRYLRQENQGVAGSRNTGIRAARGQLLTFLDGDDLWEPEKLAEHVAAAGDHPRSGVIVVDGVQFSGAAILHESLFPPEVVTLLGGRESVTLRCYERLLRGNLISSTSQVLIPRGVLDEVGLSDTRLPVSSDWDLYIRIAAAHEITFVRKRLVRWRYLETSASGPQQLRPLRWAVDHIAILKKHRRCARSEHRPLIRELLRAKTAETADQTYWYGRQSDPVWARRHLLTLLRQHPFSPVLVAFLLASYLPRPLVRLVGRTLRATMRGASRP